MSSKRDEVYIPFRPDPEIVTDYVASRRQIEREREYVRKALEAEIAADRAAGRIPPEDES